MNEELSNVSVEARIELLEEVIIFVQLLAKKGRSDVLRAVAGQEVESLRAKRESLIRGQQAREFDGSVRASGPVFDSGLSPVLYPHSSHGNSPE